MDYILHKGDGRVLDGRSVLVKCRRELTNLLNYKAEVKRGMGKDAGDAFMDIQHFYNCMSFAINAFEEAFYSSSINDFK